MLAITIIASGADYQRAVALAAATYAVHSSPVKSVTVLLPGVEKPLRVLRKYSKAFRFDVEHFPFAQRDARSKTTFLKCEAFVWKTARLREGDLALFADADTCCVKPIRMPTAARQRILAGAVGMSADVEDRHFNDPREPGYLYPHERATYVNSGVMFASRNSISFFRKVLDLAMEPRFQIGPYHDQKVINYGLGRHFRDRLVLMDTRYNSISAINQNAIIVHFAGGAGYFGRHPRSRLHARLCEDLLRFAAARRLPDKTMLASKTKV